MSKIIPARPPFLYLTRFEVMVRYTSEFKKHGRFYWYKVLGVKP